MVHLPAGDTCIAASADTPASGTHAAGLFKRISEQHPERLVIDIRQNGGGDYTLGLRYLISPIRELPSINREGHLFVLIGPQKFSAAMSDAAHFRTRTAAILVGQPIGETQQLPGKPTDQVAQFALDSLLFGPLLQNSSPKAKT